jgi:hypothetical protein
MKPVEYLATQKTRGLPFLVIMWRTAPRAATTTSLSNANSSASRLLRRRVRRARVRSILTLRFRADRGEAIKRIIVLGVLSVIQDGDGEGDGEGDVEGDVTEGVFEGVETGQDVYLTGPSVVSLVLSGKWDKPRIMFVASF